MLPEGIVKTEIRRTEYAQSSIKGCFEAEALPFIVVPSLFRGVGENGAEIIRQEGLQGGIRPGDAFKPLQAA